MTNAIRRPNLKAYGFVYATTDHRPRAFDVVARNFAEAEATARTVAAPHNAYYRGINQSLPGGSRPRTQARGGAVRFYRVAYSRDGGNSGGYSWHASRAAAVRAARQARRDDPGEYDLHAPNKYDDQMIDVVEAEPTKRGILDLLSRVAGEPTNG